MTSFEVALVVVAIQMNVQVRCVVVVNLRAKLANGSQFKCSHTNSHTHSLFVDVLE